MPNLKAKLSKAKEEEQPKNFQQEFLENLDEFSESWREQALLMEKRFQP